MSWFFWLLLILVSFAFAQLMKYAFNAKLYLFLISMVSSKKAVKILDWFERDKFWLELSKIGIFLGFGFFGILYWYIHSLLQGKRKDILPFIGYSISILIIGLLLGQFGSMNNSTFYVLNVIVFFFFGFAGFGILLLGYQAFYIIKGYISGRVSCPGVVPVIPGVTIPGTDLKIPFFEGWLALIMIMIVHELSHGVLARKVNIYVKSFGLLLLGFFPIGAFTEPDERELQKAKTRDQLLVYSSGPTFNLLFALVVFLLSLGLTLIFGSYLITNQTQSVDGLYLVAVSDYSGMCNLGVKSQNTSSLNPLFSQLDNNKESFFKEYSARIVSLDSNLIFTRLDFSKTLKEAIDKNKTTVELVLFVEDINKTKSLYYTANLSLNTDKSLGIKSVEKPKENHPFNFWYLFLVFILTTMQWTYLLSFMVGLFNYIPIKPLDGGAMLPHLVDEFIPKYTREEKRKKIIGIVGWTIIILFLTLILINALPLFI